MRLDPFVYSIRKEIEANHLSNKEFLLLVSGGKDSMVLLQIFILLRKWKDLSFRVLHIHHGSDENQEHRDRAARLVGDFCEKHQVEYLTNPINENHLKSEEDFRNYRKKMIHQFLREGELQVTAHHKEDLLETRLIRLIRGTGPEGLMAMRIFDGQIFRPLLATALEEIEVFTMKHKLSYVEDPTNMEVKYFRNWIRNQWLPELEQVRQGAKQALSQSLENIASQWDSPKERLKDWYQGAVIQRKAFLILSAAEQRQVLALFLQDNGIYEFRRSQIDELLKLLDTGRKSYTFTLLQVEWLVSQGEISIKKLA